MIYSFYLKQHEFEPIRESYERTWEYWFEGKTMQYKLSASGRINQEEERQLALKPDDILGLELFLSARNLWNDIEVEHYPYNHPSGYQGAMGVQMKFDIQAQRGSFSRYYWGTTTQLEEHSRDVHDLWRLVHSFVDP